MLNLDYKMYRIRETKETKGDLRKLVAYMVYSLRNVQAARNFLDQYEKQIHGLTTFPLGYRSTELRYQGQQIRIKPFSSYNIFYVVDTRGYQVTILRVLKNRQNWKIKIHNEDEYSF